MRFGMGAKPQGSGDGSAPAGSRGGVPPEAEEFLK